MDCPHCQSPGSLERIGLALFCTVCGKSWKAA
jgi:ribosomal protein L37AE/L43A